MRCWLIRTKRTIRTRRRNRIRALRLCPSALAAGEQFNIDGSRFLRAVALGYDVGTRVTMTVGVGGFQTATHISTHALAGTFGSAAAAGCAAGLNEQQMRWLIDYASQQASGIKTWQRDTDHIEKAFLFAGMPARNGITAALLVQAGATGVDDVLSGQDNFLADYAPQADPAKLIEKLGERYEITRTNIKKWTVGSPIQAPLDALEIILKRRPFEADQVQTVTVRVATSEAALVNNREMPDICMQHMIAVMLLDKTASFKAAHDKARMQDPAVLKQRAKVQLIPDAELERHLPAREAIVEVTLTDGTRLTETVKAVRGTAENPMPREEVIAKARDLMTPVLGAERCDKLIQTTLDSRKAEIRSRVASLCCSELDILFAYAQELRCSIVRGRVRLRRLVHRLHAVWQSALEAEHHQAERRSVRDPQRLRPRQHHGADHQRRRPAGGRQIRDRPRRHHGRAQEDHRQAGEVRHQHASPRRS